MQKKKLEKKCYDCKMNDTWNGKCLSFNSYHINGNYLDNSLENLIVLCPNCHSQRSSHFNKENYSDVFGNIDLLNKILIFLKITEIGKLKETSLYKNLYPNKNNFYKDDIVKIIKGSKKLFKLYYSYRKKYPTRTNNEVRHIIKNSKKISELLNIYREKNPIFLKDDASDDDYFSSDDEEPTPFIMACMDSYEKGIEDVKLFVELHCYHKYIKIDVVNNESDMTLKDMVCQVGCGYLNNRFNPDTDSKKIFKHYYDECTVPQLIIYIHENDFTLTVDNLKICELGKYIIGILFDDITDPEQLCSLYKKIYSRGTPFMNAIRFGRLNDLKLLMPDYDSIPFEYHDYSMSNFTDSDTYYEYVFKENDGLKSMTPLGLAVVCNHLHIVKYLLDDCKADPTEEFLGEGNDNINVLHWAIKYLDIDIIKILLPYFNNDSINNDIDGGTDSDTALDLLYKRKDFESFKDKKNIIQFKKDIVELIRLYGGRANYHDENGISNRH
jgi:hypothetical protein